MERRGNDHIPHQLTLLHKLRPQLRRSHLLEMEQNHQSRRLQWIYLEYHVEILLIETVRDQDNLHQSTVEDQTRTGILHEEDHDHQGGECQTIIEEDRRLKRGLARAHPPLSADHHQENHLSDLEVIAAAVVMF